MCAYSSIIYIISFPTSYARDPAYRDGYIGCLILLFHFVQIVQK